MAGDRFDPPQAPSLAWVWQALTGLALIGLLGLHLVANHFVVKGGLRDFDDAVTYLRHPVILTLEVLFLVVVAIHAMLGVRAIALDLGLGDRAQRLLGRALAGVGVLTVGYGLWLTWVVVR